MRTATMRSCVCLCKMELHIHFIHCSRVAVRNDKYLVRDGYDRQSTHTKPLLRRIAFLPPRGAFFMAQWLITSSSR